MNLTHRDSDTRGATHAGEKVQLTKLEYLHDLDVAAQNASERRSLARLSSLPFLDLFRSSTHDRKLVLDVIVAVAGQRFGDVFEFFVAAPGYAAKNCSNTAVRRIM